MDIQLLGALGEILAALGVLASLLYLARQVHAARTTIEAEAVRSINAAQRQLLAPLVADAEVARIVRIGGQDPQSLNGLERERFWWYMSQNLNLFQEIVLLHDAGFMNPETFRTWQLYFGMLREQSRGFREYVAGAGAIYDPRVLASLETTDLPDFRLAELAPIHFGPITDEELRAPGRTTVDR